jgi:hypothetical protein
MSSRDVIWGLALVLVSSVFSLSQTPCFAGYTCSVLTSPDGIPEAYGISPTGNIAGSLWSSSSPISAFLISGGVMTLITDPASPTGIIGFGANDSGFVVGHVNYSDTGFIYNGSTFTNLSPSGSTYTSAYAINNGGQVIGLSTVKSSQNGF